MAQTTSTESNWRIVMPDLFRVTRFLIVPFWQSIAIAGRTAIAALYSPIASSIDVAVAVQSVSVQAGINKLSHEVLRHPFRSLSMVVLAGSDNREGAQTLVQANPDYIAVESTSEDFNRQSLVTQEFSNVLGNLIRAAERFVPGLPLDLGQRVIVFDGYTCVAVKTDGIEYIIRTKTQGN